MKGVNSELLQMDIGVSQRIFYFMAATTNILWMPQGLSSRHFRQQLWQLAL